MKEVTIDTVRERINEIEMWRGTNDLRISLREEFELACLRALLGMMQTVQVLPSGWRMVPTEPQPGIDDDVRNVVALLENNEWADHCTSTELGKRLESEITRLYNWQSAKPAPVVPDKMTAIVKDEAEYVEGWNDCRAAMLNQAQASATDNTAQQFEALATSAQPEIIGYEHRLICGELRRVPKFAGQDIEATSAQREPLAVVKHYTGNTYPTLKFAQDEWSVCGDRDDVQELADAINALATSAGSGKP